MAPPRSSRLDLTLDEVIDEVPQSRPGDIVVARRIYVGNLAYQTRWQDLKDHFRQVGDVVYSSVMGEDSGKSKGCGIIEFSDSREAAAAIQRLHDSELQGRLLIVREDREDKDLKGSIKSRRPLSAPPKTATHTTQSSRGPGARRRSRSPDQRSSGGRSAGDRGDSRPGDWECDSCGKNNFARRDECFGCGRPRHKPSAAGPSSRSVKEIGGGRSGGGGGKSQPGDWECDSCGKNNFARRTECFGCGAKPKTGGDRSRDGGHSGPGRSGGDGGASRPGDWLCDSCGKNNFARREECFGCNAKRNKGASSSSIGGSDAALALRAEGSAPSRSTGPMEVKVGKRVYVGNLAYSTTWQSLKDHFRQVGKVVHTKVISEDRGKGASLGCGIVEFETPEEAAQAIERLHDSTLDGRLMTVREDRDDKDLKHDNCVVAVASLAPTFAHSSTTTRGGARDRGAKSPPRVKLHEERRSPSRKRFRRDRDDDDDAKIEEVKVAKRIFVGNLSFETTWQQLKDHFKQVGEVVHTDIIGRDESKGCGIVEFANPKDAARAMETMVDTRLNGRPMNIREDRDDRDLAQGSRAKTVSAWATQPRDLGEEPKSKRRR